ncbi:MAG: 50S ribosomal protein L18 [Myxococcaceae bacterium]|nr:50S ribosomal protein L18 [Myxococcaceae bacterium]MBH2006957.1 50S ribosomal protein L18 [Myxococcaceae bacterium]
MKATIQSLRKRNLKQALHERRKIRVRKKMDGTAVCPRLTVFKSAKHLYIQAIDDESGTTLAAASTVDKVLKADLTGLKKMDAASKVGGLLGHRLKEKGVLEAVFDRNGYRYRGRVAAAASGAREAGLNF